MYRQQLSDWIHDDRRRKEQESESAKDSSSPLFGHQDIERGRSEGFDPDNFDMKKIVGVAQRLPGH